MAAHTLRNTAPGPRGVNTTNYGYVEIAPGATIEGLEFDAGEFKSAQDTGYFAFDKDASAPDPKATKVDEAQSALNAARADAAADDALNGMDDSTLRDTVQAITGKVPPANATRDALLKMARGA